MLEDWRKGSATLGRRVRIEMVDRTLDGLAEDIDGDGALLVRTKKGLEKVVSGDCLHLR